MLCYEASFRTARSCRRCSHRFCCAVTTAHGEVNSEREPLIISRMKAPRKSPHFFIRGPMRKHTSGSSSHSGFSTHCPCFKGLALPLHHLCSIFCCLLLFLSLCFPNKPSIFSCALSSASAALFNQDRYVCHPMAMKPAKILRFCGGMKVKLKAVTKGHNFHYPQRSQHHGSQSPLECSISPVI